MSNSETKTVEHGLEPVRKIAAIEPLHRLRDVLNSTRFDILTSGGHDIGNAVLVHDQTTDREYYIIEANADAVSEYKLANSGSTFGFTVHKKNATCK